VTDQLRTGAFIEEVSAVADIAGRGRLTGGVEVPVEAGDWPGTYHVASVEYRQVHGVEVVLTTDAERGMTARAFADSVKAMALWPRVQDLLAVTLRVERSAIKRTGIVGLALTDADGLLLVPSINARRETTR